MEGQQISLPESETNPLPPMPDLPLYDKPVFSRYEKSLPKETLVKDIHAFMEKLSNLPEKPAYIFFLDKSARPLAHIMRKLWPHYIPHEPLPEIRFINIGASARFQKILQNNTFGPFRKGDVSFSGDPRIVRKMYGSHIKPNKHILVVDEVRSTGQSLKRAEGILGQAFPDNAVDTAYALSGLPAWYGEEEYTGVAEYDGYDFIEPALQQFNQKNGTKYNNYWDIPDDQRPEFDELYKSLTESVPHTQSFLRAQERKYKASDLLPKEPDEYMKMHVETMRQAREELTQMADYIIENYAPPHSQTT